jgi:ribosomal protein S13
MVICPNQNISNVKDNILKEFKKMVRLVGVDLPRNKITYVLLLIFTELVFTSAKKIVETANIDSETRVNDLTTEQSVTLRQTLEEADLTLEGDFTKI